MLIMYVFSHSKYCDLYVRWLFSVSTVDSLLLLYFAPIRYKLEYSSPVLNNITASDANSLERVQRKLVALCFTHFFSYIPYNHGCELELLKLHT
jgi:hypothetical protein